jgi:hypothetical protein
MERETIIEKPAETANLIVEQPYMYGYDAYMSWVIGESQKDWEERVQRISEVESDD